MARPTQDDFAVFTTRPKISTRDNDESSPTFGQRVVRDFTDAEWDDAKASAQYEIDNWDEAQLGRIRGERDYLLQQSDWAINNDSPLSSADQASVTTWRQELRDLPTSEADVADIVIPACPVSGVVDR
ncbi:MAG: hypothetical protein CMM02_02885 [Rhodopirellula sp.]|jgi:hypothetical protein|nr:hypothetical protein [Rhodopirellula sp.]|tara:strand:+ start:15007 stop:15390 length:384 start_codon:yes stop_codon:yes gene_type:complete